MLTFSLHWCLLRYVEENTIFYNLSPPYKPSDTAPYPVEGHSLPFLSISLSLNIGAAQNLRISHIPNFFYFQLKYFMVFIFIIYGEFHV